MTKPTSTKDQLATHNLADAFRKKPLAGQFSRFSQLSVVAAVAGSLISGAHAEEVQSAADKAKAAQSKQAAAEERAPEVVEVTDRLEERSPSSVKFARPLLDTAQTVNIISEDLMQQRAATTLRDVLRNVSGISMQAGEGGAPPGDQFSIRGYSARTDIFVDNVRDFGGYTRDPFNLEQVEVVKGPSSDYSGRGSTGGSVNLVSKTPNLTDSTRANILAGSDSYGRATLDVNRTLDGIDNAAARVNVMTHQQDVAGRDGVDNSRWGVGSSLAFGLETDTEVNLSLFHLSQDNTPDYGIPWVPANNVPLADYADQAPPVDFDNWYGLKSRDYEEVETTLGTVQVSQRLSDDATLKNTTRWGVTSRDSMVTAPRFASTDSTDIRRSDDKYRDQEDTIFSNMTDLTLTVNPGSAWEHKILVGTEVSLESEKRYTKEVTGEDSPATDLFNPDPSDPYLENYVRTGTFSNGESTTLAAYLSDSVQIDEYWQINGGLRYDHFEMEYTPDGSPLLERTDSMLSYRAGVVFKPVSAGSIYLGYGTSFNPTAEGMAISTSSRQPGIADLEPEENRSIELGTKWELADGRMLMSAALFRTDKTNARTQDPDDPNDVLVLDGEQRVQGVELGASGAITENFSVNAGYVYLDSEVLKSKDAAELGNELSNSPHHTFNLWANYLMGEKLQLGAGAQYVGDRYNSTANTRQAPDYWTLEASGVYAFSNNISAQLNLQNLTDEEYIDYVGGGHFIPGLGRTALLSLNFTY
ncbi:TonB-dependent siderophore receptor [Microbulbifer sp. CAU 1566]|uniref:TonB-dependent receptor n=1 Tax=Microbulbifer sp. CAU 1566 TaxID=2933269 RepID=UPI002004D815|nr:TonB-dependent siderophore receptor [Microbulbifer sp. CAU 1566]MCK7598389.1 TonB-dependent siderophore receptor [Microbulbifer sp. CAU 1566]